MALPWRRLRARVVNMEIIESLDPNKPTLLLDADEVLLKFVEALEVHVLNHGHELRLTSFQILGNLFHKETNEQASSEKVKELIGSFFDECVDTIQAVEGAAEALIDLAKYFQIYVLTNVPAHCRARREENLAKQGIPFPVIANKGNKGKAVKAINDQTNSHTVFIDDLPPQHTSVANESAETHRIHFIADKRLQTMLPKAPDAHVRIDTWPELHQYLLKHVQEKR